MDKIVDKEIVTKAKALSSLETLRMHPSNVDANFVEDFINQTPDKPEFLVVYEDLWSNKENTRTTQIGDAIKEFVDNYSLIHGEDNEPIDYDTYNSDYPYQAGTTGPGFYDIEFLDEDGEYAGRIFIFDL